MPPIKNWHRLKPYEHYVAKEQEAAWQNTETDEVVYLSEKVPNDGYYAMVLSAEEADELKYPGDRVGFDINKRYAYKMATNWMRNHPEGR